MFLVRVVAGQRGIVLRVDAAGGFEGAERAIACTAEIAGQDDFVRVAGGPLNRVAAEDCRPVDGGKTRIAVCRVAPEPPDFEVILARDGVDRNDGAEIRRVEAAGERIHVGIRVIKRARAGVDVAGQITARAGSAQLECGRGDALAHHRAGNHDPRGQQGIRECEPVAGGIPGVQSGGDRVARKVARILQIHIQPREHPLEGHIVGGGEPQQRPVGRMGRIQKGVETIVVGQFRARLVERILPINSGHIRRRQRDGGKPGLGFRGDQRADIVAITGHVGRP